MNLLLTMKSPRQFVCLLAVACCLPATGSKTDEHDKVATRADDSTPRKKAGDVRDDNGLKMKLICCPPGFVTMEEVERIEEAVTTDEAEDEDDPNDKPALRTIEKITQVKVLVTRGYWLGKYEVTQVEWKQVIGTEPWKDQECAKEGDDFPTSYVSWDDAMQFCRKLTERERKANRLSDGWEYTLPTEAQWERACRARTETEFSFGDDESKLGEYAWFRGNAAHLGEEYAHRVGHKRPNQWGFYDTLGNVWEWCRDSYVAKLPGGRDPEVTEKSSHRVVRGGSWIGVASFCRSANRGGYLPGDIGMGLGFRVALSAVRQPKPAQPNAESQRTIDK